MSTRANIILKEGKQELFFYRHSDGYPDGVLPTLNIFMDWLKSDKIRNNLSQGSGWLIILGAIEYGSIPKYESTEIELWPGKTEIEPHLETIAAPQDWKVGAYEPTAGIHGDIEWLYEINLDKKELTYKEV